jgi:hypothetical protein
MSHSTETAPLVLVDCRPETEEVLKAVFEPRGVIVCREIQRRQLQADPFIVVRGRAAHHAATHPQSIGEARQAGDCGSDGDACHELTLPPMFHYGDLIRTVERLLQERGAA